MQNNSLLITLLLAFLLGSLPSGFLIGLLHGVDIRKHGSGNIGATNVKRVLGTKAAILTLALDSLKGVLAVLLVAPLGTIELAPWIGFAAILGHCYSPFLKWKGGKGVATSLGVFSCIAPLPTAVAVLVFGGILKLSKVVSLSSMGAATSLLLLIAIGVPSEPSVELFGAAMATFVLVLARHKENIRRLVKGEEPKFGCSQQC